MRPETPEVEPGHTLMADIKDRRALNEGLDELPGRLQAGRWVKRSVLSEIHAYADAYASRLCSAAAGVAGQAGGALADGKLHGQQLAGCGVAGEEDDAYVWLPWRCHLLSSSLAQALSLLTHNWAKPHAEGGGAGGRILIAGSSQQRTLFFDLSLALGSQQVLRCRPPHSLFPPHPTLTCMTSCLPLCRCV